MVFIMRLLFGLQVLQPLYLFQMVARWCSAR
jgi:hypothetical protein